MATVHRLPSSWLLRQPEAQLALAVTIIGLLYLHWTPLVPDLAAQVARANVVHDSGITSWWTGWFGGLSMPTYSVLVPPGMAVFGPRIIGLAAVVLGAAGTANLTRDALRPRAGAIAFAVSGFADLLDGRVTFTSGLAFAAWALVTLRAGRLWAGVILSVAAYFASPLAGLFLGMILVAVAVTESTRRQAALWAASSLLVVGASMALMFPGTGTMPISVLDTVPAALCVLGVGLLCPHRLIRVATIIVAAAFPLFLLVPGAVGNNITRLAWVAAVPIVVACAPLPRRFLVAAAVLLAIWPASDLVGQLGSAAGPSAQQAFYQPVRTEITKEQAEAGAVTIGQRVEVVDTANHWGSVYLSALSLARGWDRQADHTYNPIFYDDNQLDATTYRQWLDDLAVGWVAVPTARLDYASVAEGSLIQHRLAYLIPVWSSRNWHLYRVLDAAPLARGAQITSVGSGGITMKAAAPATVAVRLRWSPYLKVTDAASGLDVAACISDVNGWVSVTLPRAGIFDLTSQFDPTARITGGATACTPSTVDK
jgi:hypothetical protein